MRTLLPVQTHDPGRGSFLVRPRFVRETGAGPVFVAPTEPVRDGEHFETFGNSIQFVPIKEKVNGH